MTAHHIMCRGRVREKDDPLRCVALRCIIRQTAHKQYGMAAKEAGENNTLLLVATAERQGEREAGDDDGRKAGRQAGICISG